MAGYFSDWAGTQGGDAPEDTGTAPAAAPSGGYFSSWASTEGAAPAKPKVKKGKENDVDFVDAVQYGAGQFLQQAGSGIEDVVPSVGGAIKRYGQGVMDNNPQGNVIQDPMQAITNPWQTVQQAVGQNIPHLAIGALTKTPIGAAAAYGLNTLQEYGGIRDAQRQTGVDDKGGALVAGAGAAVLDTAFGMNRLGKMAGQMMTGGIDLLKREAGKSIVKHVGKEIVKGAAEEGVTEIIQSGIERAGAHQDLTGPDAWHDYAMSGIMGAAGGGAIRGGLTIASGSARPPAAIQQPGEQSPVLDAVHGQDEVLPTQEFLDQQMGIRPPETPQARAQREREYVSGFQEAAAEPSGQYAIDANGRERALDQGQYYDILARERSGLPIRAPASTQEQVERAAGVREPMTPEQQAAYVQQFEAAAAEPSGQYVLDPETQEEVPLDQGQYMDVVASGGSPAQAKSPTGDTRATAARYGIKQSDQATKKFDVLGASVYGDNTVGTVLDELTARDSQLAPEQKTIEDAVLKAGVVKVTGGSKGTVAKAKPIINAIERKVADLQLSEAQNPEQAAAILESQINDLVTKGKGAEDPRVGELGRVYEALTGQVPQAVAKLEATTGGSNVGTSGGTGRAVSGSSGSGSAVVAGSVAPAGRDTAGGAGSGSRAPARLAKPDRAAAAALAAAVGQRAAPVAAAPAPAGGPTVVTRKKRVVTPAAPVQAFVAGNDINESDAREIAAATGQQSVVEALDAEDAGTRADNTETMPEGGVDQVLAERFKGDPQAERNTRIAKAYVAALRYAPEGASGPIIKAIAQEHNVGESTVRDIGNPTKLAAAGQKLGFSPAAVREAFGVQDNTKSKVNTDGEQQTGAIKQALTREGVTVGEGENIGFGDDASREWAREEGAGKLTAAIDSAARTLEDLRTALEAFKPLAMKRVNDVLESKIAQAQARVDAAMKEAEQKLTAEAKKTAKAVKAPPAKQAKAKPVDTGDETYYLTNDERAERNWDKVAKDIKGAPKFKDLPSLYQEEFADFDPEFQGKDDVEAMMAKMDREGVEFDQKDEDTDPDELQFGKEKARAGTYTADELRTDLAKFMRMESLGDKIEVVDNPEDLDNLRDVVTGLTNKSAFGWTRDGRVVMIASRIEKGTGRSKFLHEVGAHLGIEELLPDDAQATLVLRITSWAQANDGSIESKLALKALERVEQAQTPDESLEAEIVAYFVEESMRAGVNPSTAKGALGHWFRTVMQHFKRALEKLGMGPEELTPQDIVDIAYGAAHVALGNRAPGTGRTLFGKNTPSAAVQQANQGVKTALSSDVAEVAQIKAGQALNVAVFTRELFERAVNAGMPAAKKLDSLLKERKTATGKLLSQVRGIEEMYKRIAREDMGDGPTSANEFLKESTRQGKWGYAPAGQKVTVDPAMARRFNALKPETQKWVKAVFEHGQNMLAQKKDTVLKAINEEFDPAIKEAQAAGDSLRESRLLTNKAKQQREFQRLFSQWDGQPYAPLRRVGDFVVIGKSSDYTAAERSGDTKRMAQLEADPKHYEVTFTDTMMQAQKALRELKNRGMDAKWRAKAMSRNDMYGGLMGAFNQLREEVDRQMGESGADKKNLSRIREIVTELYLGQLAENSARKSEMQRKGIAGNIDMLQALARQGRADAHFLAAAKFNTPTVDALNELRQQSKEGEDQPKKSLILNEIVARYEQSMKHNDGPLNRLAAIASRGTSLWMLATSPAYYMQNFTQTAQLSVPYMAAKHPYLKVWREALRAYKDVIPVVSAMSNDQMDYSKLPADVRAVVQRLADGELIDVGMDTELGKVKLHGDSNATKAINFANETITTIGQRIEAVNRMTAAIAAYRLEKQAGKTDEQAADYADQTVYQTHGDYSALNAPRAFNTLARIPLQFRKFQIIQLTLLSKLVHQAFRGASPEEKKAGARALMFTLGHVVATAGVRGMPGFALLAFALAQVYGDDDDPPFDLEEAIRDSTGAGDLLMRGVPTIAGMDWSDKLGMANALSVVPFVDVAATSKGAQELGYALTLGATGALISRVFDGIDLMKQGETQKGIERMMPKGLADAMKAYREADEGVTRRNGDVLVPPEEIEAAATLAKALGVPVRQDTLRREVSNRVYQTEEHFKARGDAVRREYLRARKEGGDVDAAVESWKELQDAREAAGMKRQPVSLLLRAANEQAKREKGTVSGVQTKGTNREMVKRVIQGRQGDSEE